MNLLTNLTALSPPEDHRTAVHTTTKKKPAMLLSGANERAAVSAAVTIERTTATSRRNVDEEDEHEDADGDRNTDMFELDESVSSMQCSADLAAFPGFRARIQSHDGDTDTRDENGKRQMRLALDLSSITKQRDFRPQRVSVSQLSQDSSYSQQNYAEFFCGDTQDDPEEQHREPQRMSPDATISAPTTTAIKAKPEPIFVIGGSEYRGMQRSLAGAFLFSIENELNKRKQKNSASDTSEKTTSDALQSGSPVKKRANATANASDLHKTVGIKSYKSSGGEEFERGPQFIRDMATPPLVTEQEDDTVEYPGFASFRETSIANSPLSSPTQYQFEPTTDPADVETELLFNSHEDRKEEEGDAYDYGRRDSIDSFPDTQSLGDDDMDDDDDVDMEADKTTTRSPYSMEAKEVDNEDEDEDELPTQPSTSADTPARTTTISPFQDNLASPARAALKKRERVTLHVLPTLTHSVQNAYEFLDSSSSSSTTLQLATKLSSSASRNLAFSFAMPDSQESELQPLDSVLDAAVLAPKALNAIGDADKVAAVPPKVLHKNGSSKIPVSAVAQKSMKTFSDTASTTGASSVESTPISRKRKRAFVSPDIGVQNASTLNGGGQEATPVHSKRIAATPSSNNSTPSVRRTRAKLLSPLPSNRPYASRTKTIFKYKYEFCLTGFLQDGEAALIETIEGHGGKIAERYEDVLRKNNPKAVVIATPVSWRKRKFIYAVACGIPVVHPDWVHTCIRAGRVVPFDGFFIPSGYSITMRKFKCLPVQQLDIFAGMTFGIPYDVMHSSKTSVKDMFSLVAFVLKACGASHVIEDLQKKQIIDVVLSDEFTKELLNPENDLFQPQSHNEDDGSEQVLAATAEIGDEDRSTLKLYTGELVLADLLGSQINHHSLYHVCEILRISVVREDDDGGKHDVILEVGVLKRSPNSPGLSRVHSEILEIPASHVKGRVVAVSKTDFLAMEYGDESIFCYEGDDQREERDEEDSDDDGDDEEDDTA